VPRTKKAHLYELAALGAQAQLSDLLQEAKLLIALFPDLRDSIDKDELPVGFILKKGRDRTEARAGQKCRNANRKVGAPR
jgi:hypothetical protein